MTALPTKCLTRDEHEAQARDMIKRGGYRNGGRLRQEDDAAQDRRMVKSAVGQHETHDHKGEPKTKLRLKSGGEVKGEVPTNRMDKLARGGATKAHGKGHKPPVEVNIISPAAAEGEKKQAAAAGLQAGAKIGAAQAMRGAGPPKPPMAAPPPRPMPPPGAGPGGPPPGAMPPPGVGGPPTQGPMRRGGKC